MWGLQQVDVQTAVMFWDVCSAQTRNGGYYSVNPLSCSIGVRGGNCHIYVFKLVTILILVFCRVREVVY